MDVAEGDTVVFSKYGGTEIRVEGTDYLILRESDVLAKVVGAARARSRPRPKEERKKRTWLTRN